MTPQEKDDLLEIIRLGDPVLREVAMPVPTHVLGTPEFRRYCHQLMLTMLDAQGVGLAAPQVAEGLRCFAYYIPGQPEPEVRPTVLVNPELTLIENDIVEDWEGCLSIPGMRGMVPRAHKVEVQALSVEGAPLSFVAEGFHARVLQHEFDHLEGIIYFDRMKDLQTLSFEEEWLHFVHGVAWEDIYEMEGEGEEEETGEE